MNIGDKMGKGPGAILKDCIAKAILNKQKAGKEDLETLVYEKTGFYSLTEQDVRRIFLSQDYSEKTTDKYIKQWADLDLVHRLLFRGHNLILFDNLEIGGPF